MAVRLHDIEGLELVGDKACKSQHCREGVAYSHANEDHESVLCEQSIKTAHR